MKNYYINNANFIDKIDEFTEKYKRLKNVSVINVSSWKTSNKFRESILKNLEIPEITTANNAVEYYYYYDIDNETKLTLSDKLGCNENDRFLLLPNNTVALNNCINFISKRELCPVCLLTPCYFTIEVLLKNFNLKYDKVSMLRDKNGYSFPSKISAEKYKVLIISNPVYCTGSYLINENLCFIEKFLKAGGVVISDESISLPEYSLINKLGKYESFIGIYSPHKAIHINAFKFSCLVFHKKHEKFFDHWNDVFCGSLNLTNIQALMHFLSPNYEKLKDIFLEYVKSGHKNVSSIVECFPQVDIDKNVLGDYISIYNKYIPYKNGNSFKFVKETIKQTCVAFYPGCLFDFNKKDGLVFRVNLTLYDSNFKNSLLKLLNHMQKFI